MGRPTSDVAICNLALDLIKEAPITTLSSPTDKTSALCGRWFPIERESTLSAYNWNFALKSRAIQRGGTPEVSDYPDYYPFPNDYLKLRAILDPEIPLAQRRYEIQGKNLFYDNGGEASLDIWYTKDETDVSLYPGLFINLLAHRLALRLGKKLTGKASIMNEIRTDLKELLMQARGADGQIRPPTRYESSRIVNAGLNVSSGSYAAGNYEFPEGMDE
jgi:hypothetical protein